MSDEYTCEECDRSFDSERGLHIHQGRVHDMHQDAEQEDEADTNADDGETGVVAREEDGRVSVSMSVFHAIGVTFVLGIVFGGFIMGAAAQVTQGTGLTGDQTAQLLDQLQETTGSQGTADGQQDPQDAGDAGSGSSPTVQTSKISLEGEPMLGEPDAPVTIVEYTDLQCPFCTRHDNQTFGQIKENYIDTGQVRYVVKDFPIPQLGHDQAEHLARAGNCMLEQDLFWEYKETIMDAQMAMAPRGTARFGDSQVTDWVRSTGADMDAYTSCMESSDGSEFREDKQEGNNFTATVGGSPFISGTPSFVIYRSDAETGTPVVGAQPYSAFESEITAKLEG